MDNIREEENDVLLQDQIKEIDTEKISYINSIKIKIFDLNEIMLSAQQQIVNLRQELVRLQQQ